MKRTLALTSTAAVLLALTSPAAQAAQAARPPSYDLRPAALERGPDVRVAHVEDGTVVDGATRIPVAEPHVSLLGTFAASYIVQTRDSEYTRTRVWRLETDGSRTRLLKGRSAEAVELSDHGATLASATYLGKAGSRLLAIDVATGATLADRVFQGDPSVLDVAGSRVAIASWNKPRTRLWNTATGKVRILVKRPGSFADLSSNQFAYYTKDPYRGGCTVLAHVDDPTDRVWRSCRERIDTINPDGTRLATIHILADGIGPDQVILRRNTGARLATYNTSGWFGAVQFEDRLRLLLRTNGKKYAATVRCDTAGCERASRLRPVKDLLRLASDGRPQNMMVVKREVSSKPTRS